MSRVGRLFVRPVVIAVCCYLMSLGATFNGVVSPEIAQMTLALTALLFAAWIFAHWRGRWNWHQTPLDSIFALWILAFTLSLAANFDAARRIAIGLWYVGLYIGIWYTLHDLLANRAFSRETLVDALLISGVLVIGLGYWQLQSWLSKAGTAGFAVLGLPRPVSVFGNPNFLGCFLVVVIPFALSRAVSARPRLNRFVMSAYSLLALFLLFLTYSRSAWVGCMAGAAVWLGLFLAGRKLLSRTALFNWWNAQKSLWRTAALVTSLAAALITLITLVLLVRSFSEAGRSTGLRTEIYGAALELFSEKPITGQGLFTFGRGLVRLADVQPDKPHSHAHSAPLHVAAELGIVGLAALGATLVVMTQAARRNWKAMQGREALLLAGAISAVVGFGVDQLTDVPAMMPAIALSGLIALIIALAPVKPVITVGLRRFIYSGVALCWTGLLISGLWSNRVYDGYVSALSYATSSHDYREAALRLQPIIDADPNLSLYSLEQGFLYGMAASTGDTNSAQAGIAAYQHFIALDPGEALAWANKAGLEWQLGEQAAAVQSMQQAFKLDPNVWQYALNLGHYAEVMGDTEATQAAYDQVLRLYPDASLYPDFPELIQGRNSTDLSASAQIALLIESGQAEQALQLWQGSALPQNSATYILRELIALGLSDQNGAVQALKRAEGLTSIASDSAWVHLGRSQLAYFLGETSLGESELKTAREALQRGILDGDDEDLLNIAYAQFLRFTIPRQFLPQVEYPIDDPILLYLLES